VSLLTGCKYFTDEKKKFLYVLILSLFNLKKAILFVLSALSKLWFLGRYEEDTSVKKTELKAMRGNKVATIKSLKEQKERSELYSLLPCRKGTVLSVY
jgi:hypothetical protein